MAEPKSYEPEKVTAGVTWKWKKTFSDYPASEWTLTYYLRKNGATATSFNATADGDTHLVTVAAATTAAYASGIYDFIGWAQGHREVRGVQCRDRDTAQPNQLKRIRSAKPRTASDGTDRGRDLSGISAGYSQIMRN